MTTYIRLKITFLTWLSFTIENDIFSQEKCKTRIRIKTRTNLYCPFIFRIKITSQGTIPYSIQFNELLLEYRYVNIHCKKKSVKLQQFWCQQSRQKFSVKIQTTFNFNSVSYHDKYTLIGNHIGIASMDPGGRGPREGTRPIKYDLYFYRNFWRLCWHQIAVIFFLQCRPTLR